MFFLFFFFSQSNKILGDTAVILIGTPYCIGTLIALFLNAIIPFDEEEHDEEEVHEEPLKPFDVMPVVASR